MPLNHDVFIPDWSDKVSHDIPFSDGESGIIRLKLKNLTAMHISNGKDDKNISFPCHIMKDGKRQYFIPATSIKGMIRSVAEVLSFAKFSQFNDDYFGYRIFMNPKSEAYKRYHREMEDPLCGFLSMENDEKLGYILKINSCGRPEKVEISLLSKIDYESEGKTLVKSGEMHSKKHEHLFGPKSGEIYIVPSEVEKKFRTIYKPNRDFEKKWIMLKHGGELPVFFHLDKNGEVKHLGFSKNYRLPYLKHVEEGARQTFKDCNGHKAEGYDMIETLFGYTSNSKGTNSLKGRVQFGHAFSPDVIDDDSLFEVKGVLGQPQASFTPLYLKPNAGGRFASYNDDNLEIAGRKRYRVHANDVITNIPTGNDNEKVMSTLKLIPAGHTFELVIAVHNLKPAETGLLLSALTFHNTSAAHHNLGMAKSYGYGKIAVEDIHLEGFVSNDVTSYLKAFEWLMCNFTVNTQSLDWSQTEQIRKLISIAADHRDKLDIMTLDDYKEAKKDANFNQVTDMMKEKPVTIKGFVTRADINAEQERLEAENRKAEEAAQALIAEEKAAAEKALQEAAAKALAEKRANEAAEGISFLNAQDDKGGYKVKKWDSKRVDQWLKKQKLQKLPSEQVSILQSYYNRVKDTIKPKEMDRVKKSVSEWLNPNDSFEF